MRRANSKKIFNSAIIARNDPKKHKLKNEREKSLWPLEYSDAHGVPKTSQDHPTEWLLRFIVPNSFFF